ncbi:MAG: polysaccharide pyruvyl transferase family protein [Synergistaceae bacterium]|jgi:polysaccharide pyruvyl transferase CsaB|nr:polysaccharide pyruvyl transferase family protein [Synergistaceae bacterium]
MAEGRQGDIRVNPVSQQFELKGPKDEAPESSGKSFDVLLAGYYGFGNLGDELLASGTIDFLTRAGIKRERIAILSKRPRESSRVLGIEAFDRGLVTRSLNKALSASISLLIAGGGIFQDSTSVRSCFYYWALVRKARRASCRVAAISQSVGPLSSFLGKMMTHDALLKCAYLSVRDITSLELTRTLGLEADLCPDIVMALDIPRLLPAEDGDILVNVRPIKDARAARNLLKAASACAESGMRLKGIALSEEDKSEFERYFASGVLPPCEVCLVKSSKDFIEASEGAFAAIGMRLHFGVLSLLRGLKLAMAPYDPKVTDFARKWDALCPEFRDDDVNSDIMRLLTKSLFKDKKQPDHDKAARALDDAFKKALSLALGDVWMNE